MKNTKQNDLSRIVRYLMLQTSSVNNLGLLNGKMGISIFFYNYARYVDKKLYDDFAGELIDEIYKELHKSYSCNFENGLTGIGWGLEYIIHNKFVKADRDVILENVDYKVQEKNVRRMRDFSLQTGLKGIAYYVVCRCSNRISQNPFIDSTYVKELMNSLLLIDQRDKEIEDLLVKLDEILISGYCCDNKDGLIYDLVCDNIYKSDTLVSDARPLGLIKNGYAGIGLNLIIKGGIKK